MKEHLKLLGHKVRDKVTRQEGVVTAISFDLYGRVQALVEPGTDATGRPLEQFWFDVNRLAPISGPAVMEQPDFEVVRGGDVRNLAKG